MSQYCYVQYHSDKWALLVETGWFTVFVGDDGFAYMIKER